MSIFVLVLLILASMVFGFFVATYCIASGESEKRIQEILNIGQKSEEIIQVLIDEGFIETGRTEGDYDLGISPKGTEDIQKILGGVL